MLKRRRYLIDSRFQLRWTALIALGGGFIATLFASFLWISLADQDTLVKSSMAAEQSLRAASDDVSILLLNMPETTAIEAEQLRSHIETQAKSSAESRRLFTEMLEKNERARCALMIFVVLLVLGLFAWGIFVTHRIAGPMFVIKKQLATFRETGSIETRPLRKGDEFHDVYEELRQALTGKGQKPG
ncbi:MAG: hypothetical protein HY903_05705 [Deltaproteobacteria bacterium]|nr:hypothetical protein [Deltaproteobacteria bacterium]